MRVSQIEASALFYTPQSLRDSSPILGEQLIATDNQQLILFNSTLPKHRESTAKPGEGTNLILRHPHFIKKCVCIKLRYG